MPWSKADREKYDVIRERYSSDLSDAEFALIFPLLPAPKRRGRKATCAREILNALFYLIRSGCPWRLLPKDFPPFTTVQNRFYAWRDSGLWSQIVCVLVMGAREAEGRDAAPTAVVVDSQSVKTTEAGGPRGFDAAKATRRSAPRSRRAASPSPSSSATTSKSRASSCCRNVGSLSGRSAGSTVPDDSPKTSSRPSSPPSLGSSSLSPSCSLAGSQGHHDPPPEFRVGLLDVGFEVRWGPRPSSLRHHAARRAAITIVYRLYGER